MRPGTDPDGKCDMKVWAKPPSRARIATIAVVGAALTCAVFGYTRADRRCCAACGALTKRTEWGLALSLDLCLPLSVADEVSPMPNVARFLPPDHVHGRYRSLGFSQKGPFLFMGAIGHGKGFPGAFAYELAGTPGFADFVASQIEAGKVDAATVRALIAEPMRAPYDGADDADHLALVRRGEELLADFRGAPPVPKPADPGEHR